MLSGAGVLIARGVSRTRIWGRIRADAAARRVQSGFDDLANQRQLRGLPAAGSADDAATLSRMQIGEDVYYGANRGIQDPRTAMTLERVNAQTLTHAEADVVQQVINRHGRLNGGRAEMWVDRALCSACGLIGGARSLARNLGVDELVVHSPEGTQIFTPTR